MIISLLGLDKGFKEQLKRIMVVAYTDRGKLIVTTGKPRVFYKSWGKLVLGYDDEPWELSAGVKTDVKFDIERIGGRIRGAGGIELVLPNWWIVAITLSGWYRLDVYIDEKLVLSKPQVSVWEGLNEPQPAYGLFKLGEHPPLVQPLSARFRWNMKWSIERYLTHLPPPLAEEIRRLGWVEMFLRIRRWDDR